MSANFSFNNSATKAFVDLATYDQPELAMYGGNDAITYFVRKLVKATWFAKAVTVLSRGACVNSWSNSSDIDFTISRVGDYMLYNWLRIQLPAVSSTAGVSGAVSNAAGMQGVSFSLRWTRNLAHHLIEDQQVTFNDLQADIKKNRFFYDAWSAYNVPASKRVGYDNMVGNVNALVNPLAEAVDPFSPGLYQQGTLPAYTLNLPLHHPFSRDTGISLPTAALPYNEMKIKFSVKPWSQCLIVDAPQVTVGGTAVNGGSYSNSAFDGSVLYNILTQNFGASQPAVNTLPGGLIPVSTASQNALNSGLQIDCWATYAIVSNQERVRMGSCPRDMLVEQSQMVMGGRCTGTTENSTDIRFSYPMKTLFTLCQNTTNPAEHSNYTCGNPVVPLGVTPGVPGAATGAAVVAPTKLDNFRYSTDPIKKISLFYENDSRFEFPNDYASLVEPFYANISIPEKTGYHGWNYALVPHSVDPTGSTNYGKLTNATVVCQYSNDLIDALSADAITVTLNNGKASVPLNGQTLGGRGFYFNATSNTKVANSFQFIHIGVNFNFVRVSGGALGFPIL
jgi:hypothetical protein